MSAPFVCGPKCWTEVRCPVCGMPFPPVGRSVPLEAANGYCCTTIPCDPADEVDFRWRHLWSEHDDARHYTDPDGWAEHVSECEECSR